MQKFCTDQGYLPPDEVFTSKKHMKKCFVKYMHAYQDLFRYNWFMHDWYSDFAESLYEGYRVGHAFFAEYLDGSTPFRWHHYFEFHYFKQFIKRLLGK